MKNSVLLILVFILILFSCSSERKTITTDFIPPDKDVEEKDKTRLAEEENRNVIFNEINRPSDVQGFKIILYESDSQDKVRLESQRALVLLDKSINVGESDGKWKILISGFKDLTEAEKYLLYLAEKGWRNAYIEGFKKTQQEIKPVITEKPEIIVPEYHIQLAAVGDRLKADEMKNNLLKLGYKNIKIIHENNFYKIRNVNIHNEETAKRLLNEYKNVGFKDAWIIKVK